MHNNDLILTIMDPSAVLRPRPKAPGLESARLRCFSTWHEMSTATVSRYGRYRAHVSSTVPEHKDPGLCFGV